MMENAKIARLWSKFHLLFLGLSAAIGAFSLPAQKLIYPGEWPYDALTALSLEQRVLFLSGSTLSVLQFESMLAEIDDETLSPSGKILYDKLRAYLKGDGFFSLSAGAVRFDTDPVINPELYYRTDEDIKPIYDNNKRRPFALLPLGLSLSSYVTVEWDLNLQQDLRAVDLKNNYVNFPAGETAAHFAPPNQAYLVLGFPLPNSSGIQFRTGIGEDFFGRTNTGSIVLSDYMKQPTYAVLSLYSPVAKYSANVFQLDVEKYFYFHHIEARFFKRVSLSLLEGLVVNAPMELRFLNPAMMYHSMGAYQEYGEFNGEADNKVASFFGLRLEVQLLKNVRFYGIWAMNELQTPREQEEDADAWKANSMALQWGAEGNVPVAGGGRWTFGAEGVYTYPFVYVLRDEAWSLYKPGTPKASDIPFWIGTPFGPDTAAASLWAGYHAEEWSCSGAFLFAAQGEHSGLDIFTKDDKYHPFRTARIDPVNPAKAREEISLVSPSGIPAFTYQISFSAEWSPKKWITLSLDPGYKIINNFNHVEGELRHGFEAALGARFTSPWQLHF